MLKRNHILNTFKLLIIVVGIMAFIVAFLPAVSYSNSDSVFKGFELAFGTEFLNLGSFGSGQIEFNLFIILAYLLPIVACFLTIFLKRGEVISILLFIASLILLFLIPELTVASITVLGNTNVIEVEWTMAYGLYLAVGIVAFGAILSIFKVVTSTAKN